MRTLVCAFLLTLILSPNENIFGQENNLSTYKSHFHGELRPWTKTINDFKLSSFKASDSIAFQNQPYLDIKTLKDFYSIYKPALTFSADNNIFIDIYSYELNLAKKGNRIVYSGSEADQAISLCNIKAKTWTQILFCGYSLRIQEVTWLSNTKFILVGSVQNEESKFRPVIYLGDTKKNSFEIFTSDDTTSFQNENYDSPKIAKLKIQQQ